ncbi:hypothetical protein HYN59_07125 [Flavobacterium album]|uniref:Uncharacterized protein n=2 Tax=Flavobacterium album TaxID=2175091 RepID=A0A2S1QWX2_9FLAO|nr:hypothetical protein HYN59_07125 [Flavobacterium album]
MIACSKNEEQIEPLKAELIKSYGKSQEEVDSYTYSVHDAYAKEVHMALNEKYLKLGEYAMDAGNMERAEEALKSMDSLEAALPKDKDKKYYAVHAYKLRDNDTIFNVYYYMDTNNKLVAVSSRK